MAKLLFPSGKIVAVPRGILSLGRAEIARYSEAVTVSRVQCTVERLIADDGKPALRLISRGTQNPTLLIGPGGEPRGLCQDLAGQSAQLRDGDKFSLISTRPDLAVQVQLPQEQGNPGSDLVGAATAQLPSGLAEAPKRVAATAEPSQRPLGAAALELHDPGAYATAGMNSPSRSSQQAAEEPYSSSSKAFTSNDGKDGGGGVSGGSTAEATSDYVLGASACSGAPQAWKAAERKVGGRGGKATSRGVSNCKLPTRTAPPVLLLLAGLPGSGKSTFSRALLAASPIAWVHVNQDAIRDGRPGTREQCVAAARTALEQGACCVVDRCHGDAMQRDALRAVAAERGLAAHCVALQTPLELCAKRVAARTDHPGGVQGDTSKRVVYAMATQMKKANSWPPASSEGFTSVMECHNEADAAAAVRAWAVYGSSEIGEPPASGSAAAATTLGIWREHMAKRKPASGGLLSFFKPAGTAATGVVSSGPGATCAAAAAAAKAGASGHPADMASSLATTTTVKAAPAGGIAMGKGGLSRAGKGGVASGNTTAGSMVPVGGKMSPSDARRPREEPPSEARGAKRQAIETPKTGGWQAGGGSGVASASASAAAGVFASPAYEVSFGAGKGGAKDSGGVPGRGCGEASDPGSSGKAGRNAFAVLMASASRKAANGGGRANGDCEAGPTRAGNAGSGKTDDEPDARFKLSAPWAQALRNTALHPEQAQQELLFNDDKVIMMYDAFPKAKHHALVIARDPMLRSIADLRGEHLPLLAHMQHVARQWVLKARNKDPAAAAFKLGFHAVPSMCQLHMHVVSQDFESPTLKNKKHWNSFTSRFFLPAEAVQHELETRGRLMLINPKLESELLGGELLCHGCGRPVKSMPELKKHIATCEVVKRLPGL